MQNPTDRLTREEAEMLDALERHYKRTGFLAPLAGGDTAAPVAYPLAPATVSGTLVTMDQLLASPTVMHRMVVSIANQRFFMHRVFSGGPTITGGTLLYERPNPLLTDLYPARKFQAMAPGTEAPELTFLRGVPMVGSPTKLGAKWKITREQRTRTSPQPALNAINQAGNGLMRSMEELALGTLNGVIAEEEREVAGQSWLAASETPFSERTEKEQPLHDFLNVRTTIEKEERGVELDSAIFNPTDWGNLATVYGDDANVTAMLTAAGITSTYRTPRQPEGKVKLFETGQVGVWCNEFDVGMRSWLEEDTDQTQWYQLTVGSVVAVTDQFELMELTGV